MDFVSRLKEFIDFLGMANSQFADTAQIPRPSLSQILNGRNKKISNEFIAKIHEAFPQLNVLWLMFGDGDMVTDSSMRFSRPQNDPNLFDLSAQASDDKRYPSSEIAKNPVTNFTQSREPYIINAPESADARPYMRSETTRTQSDDPGRTPQVSDTFYAPADSAAAGPTYGRLDDSERSHCGKNIGRHPDAFATPRRDQPAPDPYPVGVKQPKHTPSEESGFVPNLAVDNSKKVASIMVFYTDNSFEIFRPSERAE